MSKTIDINDVSTQDLQILVGPQDKYLKELEAAFQSQILLRDNQFIIEGKEEVLSILKELVRFVKKNHSLSLKEVQFLIQNRQGNQLDFVDQLQIGRTFSGKSIKPKTLGQYHFAKAMENNTIVIAIGPAGTGKTFLAVVKAVTALKNHEVDRIILTRPAVEAGESLGFLPGDLKEKVDPYLTPLYDALHTMLGLEQTEKLMEKGTIEIAPLAYMRGRTLENAYIILDEAQNTSNAQMKMFLTRLGFHSKMIIAGDSSQVDLKDIKLSGLADVQKRLAHVNDIAVVTMDGRDVVRHPLVQKIVEAYEK
ncbi:MULTISPECIES: PhoH family protein [Terrabacteria group]|uniref:PhoH family protein n=1 Tax=Bacillati TaxID=1783272 RepID=UPI001C6F0E3D|nr:MULTISPECIES: PhoH family protein [Terrabacteria group]MBW9212382.1 PhoH family protein [Trueperella sp. zg.1013]